MRRSSGMLVVLSVMVMVWGCGEKGEKVIAKINDQKITQNELEFSLSQLARSGRPVDVATKKKVFEQLITKALLMNEANRLGLTKDRTLLQKIEREKERIILDELVRREIQMFITVSDEDVKQAYENYSPPKGKKPSFDEVKDHLRQQLMKQKQTEAFNTTLKNLRDKAKINIDEKALNDVLTRG